jgi:hypothetical protein
MTIPRRRPIDNSEVATPGYKHGEEEDAGDDLQHQAIKSVSVLASCVSNPSSGMAHTVGSAHPGSFHAGLLFHMGSSTGAVMLKVDMVDYTA